MSEEQSERDEGADEISLVDLLAVVLRYRKLIIALPLVATVAAALWIYAAPAIGIESQKRNYTVQISVGIDEMPANLGGYINLEPDKLFNASFSSLQFIEEAYIKHFPGSVKGMKEEDRAAFIQDKVIGKRLKYGFNKDLAIYTLSFKDEDKSQAEAFLMEIWNKAASTLQERLVSKFSESLSILKQQLDASPALNKLDSGIATKAALMSDYQQLLSYQAKPNFPFNGKMDRMVIADAKQSRSKILILVLVGSLFVALLAAFVANAARGIKNNPEDMAKLRSALKG